MPVPYDDVHVVKHYSGTPRTIRTCLSVCVLLGCLSILVGIIFCTVASALKVVMFFIPGGVLLGCGMLLIFFGLCLRWDYERKYIAAEVERQELDKAAPSTKMPTKHNTAVQSEEPLESSIIRVPSRGLTAEYNTAAPPTGASTKYSGAAQYNTP